VVVLSFRPDDSFLGSMVRLQIGQPCICGPEKAVVHGFRSMLRTRIRNSQGHLHVALPVNHVKRVDPALPTAARISIWTQSEGFHSSSLASPDLRDDLLVRGLDLETL